MTVWDFLDKHAQSIKATARLAFMGLMYLYLANDPSWDEARYLLLAGGAEALTAFRKPTGG